MFLSVLAPVPLLALLLLDDWEASASGWASASRQGYASLEKRWIVIGAGRLGSLLDCLDPGPDGEAGEFLWLWHGDRIGPRLQGEHMNGLIVGSPIIALLAAWKLTTKTRRRQ